MKRLLKVFSFIFFLLFVFSSIVWAQESGALVIKTGSALGDIAAQIIFSVVAVLIAWFLKRKAPKSMIELIQDFAPIAVQAVEQISATLEKNNKITMTGKEKLDKAMEILDGLIKRATNKALAEEDKNLATMIIEAVVGALKLPNSPNP